ncbi:MAG TPA: 5-formyltetrahydrofolate cyclo-ligase [Planctomycetota bacterium]|nr:5-formyltetrahydrofolate cyclo-ligase [Planctomycetota bacterium]
MEKAEARKEIKRRIAALSPAERTEKSARIREKLLALPEFAEAGVVMLFASMADEADTFGIIEAALAAGKTVVLPKVEPNGRVMTARCVTNVASDTTPGAFGILEPAGGDAVEASRIDFCLVPARAFDRLGRRLGRGAGCYDRFMADPGFKAFRCGIAFREQILEHVPDEQHDLPVELIVTDDELIKPH